MSFSKYHQIFSLDNIFLIPIDDTYHQHHKSALSYTHDDSNDGDSDVLLTEDSSSRHSNCSCEGKTLQTQNIFKGNLTQKINSLKTKTKEDYIHLFITNNDYHSSINNIFN